MLGLIIAFELLVPEEFDLLFPRIFIRGLVLCRHVVWKVYISRWLAFYLKQSHVLNFAIMMSYIDLYCANLYYTAIFVGYSLLDCFLPC